MSDIAPPMCQWCKHLDKPSGKGYTCRAFPEGIPKEIYLSKFDHRKPYPDDKGIRFKPVGNSRADFSIFDEKRDT